MLTAGTRSIFVCTCEKNKKRVFFSLSLQSIRAPSFIFVVPSKISTLHSFETKMSYDDPVHVLDLWHMQLLQTALDEEEMECKNSANNSLVDSKQSSSSALNNNQTKESVVVAITFTRDNTPLHPKQVITVRLTTRSSHSEPSVAAAAAAAGHPTAQ